MRQGVVHRPMPPRSPDGTWGVSEPYRPDRANGPNSDKAYPVDANVNAPSGRSGSSTGRTVSFQQAKGGWSTPKGETGLNGCYILPQPFQHGRCPRLPVPPVEHPGILLVQLGEHSVDLPTQGAAGHLAALSHVLSFVCTCGSLHVDTSDRSPTPDLSPPDAGPATVALVPSRGGRYSASGPVAARAAASLM